MPIHSASRPLFTGPRRQKGMVATFIAVIVLVATLMAAVALMRSVDTSNSIAGSIAFRQSLVQEAERAYQAAKAAGMPIVDPANLAPNTDNPALGYSAIILPANTRKDVPDVLAKATPTTPCSTGCVVMPTIAATQNKVSYVVERLCQTQMEGLPADKKFCVVPGAVVQGGGLPDSGSLISHGVALAAYRLTVRVDGPKNALGYVQTIMR